MTRLLLMVLASALLAGCTATGPKYVEIKPQLGSPAEGQGRVFFFREAAFVFSAVQPDVAVNGSKVGTSMPGGFFFVDLAAGQHVCSATTEVERKLSFALDSGETKYIKTSPSVGVLVGRLNFQLTSAVDAEKQLENLHYTGAPVTAPAKAEQKQADTAAVPST